MKDGLVSILFIIIVAFIFGGLVITIFIPLGSYLWGHSHPSKTNECYTEVATTYCNSQNLTFDYIYNNGIHRGFYCQNTTGNEREGLHNKKIIYNFLANESKYGDALK